MGIYYYRVSRLEASALKSLLTKGDIEGCIRKIVDSETQNTDNKNFDNHTFRPTTKFLIFADILPVTLYITQLKNKAGYDTITLHKRFCTD